MRLFPKKLTDDEFVEKQRKNLRHLKWITGIFVPLFIIGLIIIIIMYTKLIIISYEINSELHYNYEKGLFCGICGIIFCFILIKGIIFLQLRFGNRMEKLIIKYIDDTGKSGIKNERDIAYSQRISKAIKKDRGIGWLWVVGAIVIFISPFTYEDIYRIIESKKIISVNTIIGIVIGFMLAEKIFVFSLYILVFPRMTKKISMLIKYYDIVKEKSGAVSSEN